MARQALRVTKETTPGTYNGANTTTVIRLDKDNLFTQRPTPNMFSIRDAGGGNRKTQTGYGTVMTGAKLSTILYASQGKLLLPWMFNIISDGSGSFKPAYTCTLDFFGQMEDSGGTLFFQRYLGCYIDNAKIGANNSGDGVVARLDSSIRYLSTAAITATDFPAPALNTYPSDQPMIFEQFAGNFTLGTSRTGFSSLDISCDHILDVLYDESPYPQAIKWCGRDVSASANFRFKALTDRNTFSAVTSNSAAAALYDGTNTITFQMETNNFLTAVDDDMPLGKAHRQKVSWASYLDVTNATDLVVTQTP